VESGGAWGRVFLEAWMRRTADGLHELRHASDRDAPPEVLERLPDVSSLHTLARSDGAGAHRPLRSAPDLRSGWRLSGLSGEELWTALAALYPADAVRWFRHREGTLPVVPFPATAARQSGMYARVGELQGAGLEGAVAECCGGGRCLRTPLWALGSPPAPGAGVVPCPEACSLFVSHARERLEARGAALSTTARASG
jgi:hypothetical protein